MEPLVSIIVPVYNSEKTIDRCIKSLLNQTYQNLEIIIIDDGSTDNSLAQINNYAGIKQPPVRIYSQSNQKQGKTRNRGMSLADGEYLTFVDSDDYLETDFIEQLVKPLLKNDADIVISGIRRVIPDKNKTIFFIPKQREWTKYKYPIACSKLFKTAFIKEHKLSFMFDNYAEDLHFCLTAYSYTDKIVVISYAGYNYTDTPGSSMNLVSSLTEEPREINCVLRLVHQQISDDSYLDKKSLAAFFYKTIIFNICHQRKNIPADKLKKMLQRDWQWLTETGYPPKMFFYRGEEVYVTVLLNLFFIAAKTKLIGLLLKLIKLM